MKYPLSPEMLRIRRIKAIVGLVTFVALAASLMYFPVLPKPESHTLQVVRLSVSSFWLIFGIVLFILGWTGRRIPFSRYN